MAEGVVGGVVADEAVCVDTVEGVLDVAGGRGCI